MCTVSTCRDDVHAVQYHVARASTEERRNSIEDPRIHDSISRRLGSKEVVDVVDRQQ